MSLRKYKRGITKAKCYAETHSTKGFHDAWDKCQDAKYGEEKRPIDSNNFKHVHLDSPASVFSNLRRFKEFVAAQFEADKKAREAAVEVDLSEVGVNE